MLAPTPLLPLRPLDVGDVFGGAFTILRRRFGTFLGISAVMTLLPMVLILVGTVPFVMTLLSAEMSRGRPDLSSIAPLVLLLLVVVLVSLLIQLKAQAMLAQGAYETAQGAAPTVRSLITSTRGFLRRIVPAILAVAAIASIVSVGGTLTLIGLASAATANRNGGATAGALGVVAAVAFVLVVAWLSIKMFYWLAAAAIEQRPGFAALRRSWDLTKGAFWRTLGSYLLASLLTAAITFPVSMVSQVLASSMVSAGTWTSGRDPMAVVATLGPVLLIWFAVQFLLAMLVASFMGTYQTVMFIDQVRRTEDASEPLGFPGAQPGQWGQQPAQSWGAAPVWTPPAPPAQQWGQAPTPPPPPTHAWGDAPSGQTPPQPQHWPGAPGQGPAWPGQPGSPPNP